VPFKDASIDSGIAGYCEPSKSLPMRFSPSTHDELNAGDEKLLGFISLSRDMYFRCNFVQPDGKIVTGKVNLAVDLSNKFKGPMTLGYGPVHFTGTYAAFNASVEGDHQVVMGLFNMPEAAPKVIGSIRLRGAHAWVRFDPTKDEQGYASVEGRLPPGVMDRS
jgi:hypothetical protein